MRTSRALSRHKTRARCRVQKLPRIIVSQNPSFDVPALAERPRRGAVRRSGVLEYSFAACAPEHATGRELGCCGAYVPLSCITCAMPPTAKTSRSGRQLTRVGSGLSRNLYARVGVGIFAAHRNDPGGADLAACRGALSRCSFVV